MQIIFRLIFVLLFIGVPCGTHAAKKDLTDNVTYSNPQLSFGAADDNDQELYDMLDGTAPTNGPLNIGGSGDSALYMLNNATAVDDITGLYGIRFLDGVLQQIINGTPSSIGSGGSEPTIQAADPVTGDATGWYIATDNTKLFYNVTGDANYDFGTYTKNTYAAACATDSITTVTGGTQVGSLPLTANAWGQSFQVDAARPISAIDYWNSNSTAGGTVELRWGYSRDLTTVYEGSVVINVLSSDDGVWKTGTFTNKGDTEIATTYYLGLVILTGDASVGYDNTDPYADGAAISATTGFNMSSDSPGNDLNIRIRQCDP